MKKLLLLIIFLPVYSFAQTESIIGRWCDRSVPSMPKFNYVMSIVINSQGSLELISNFSDGSRKVTELKELSAGTYELINSGFGEKYRISPSDGNLQLIDNEGLIRIASRLENTQKLNECS